MKRVFKLIKSIPDATELEKAAIYAAVLHVSDEMPTDTHEDSPCMERFRKKFGALVCFQICDLTEEICSPSN